MITVRGKRRVVQRRSRHFVRQNIRRVGTRKNWSVFRVRRRLVRVNVLRDRILSKPGMSVVGEQLTTVVGRTFSDVAATDET